MATDNNQRRNTGAPDNDGNSLEITEEFFETSPEPQEAVPLRGRAAFTGDPLHDKGSGFIPKRNLSNDSIMKDGPSSGSVGYKGIYDKKRILLVEDDQDQLNVLGMIFKAAEYNVSVAVNGLDGLQMLEKDKTDLIICDLMMPKMNGAEFVSRVRCDPRFWNIPIMILTVMSDPEKEYALLSIGADDYCEKSVQRKILLKRVENLLGKINLRN